MQSWTIIGLAVAGGVVVLAAMVSAAMVLAVRVIATARRRRPSPADPATRTTTRTMISRRDLINRGIIGGFVAALSGVVASAVAFAWSELTGTSAHRYGVGGLGPVRQRLSVDRRPYVGANGRFYLVPFPTERLAEAERSYPPEVVAGMRQGLVALSPICTHQGCHVPYCESSGWFECPCHGSRFDRIGERRQGPAPRGLDHFALSVEGGLVTVDTGRTYLGPPPGTETIDDPPTGPHCF